MKKMGKYKTCSGLYAVVLCNNAPGKRPIVGYIISRTQSKAVSWLSDGSYHYFGLHSYDLEEFVGRNA